MFGSILLIPALAAFSSASPILLSRASNTTSPFVYTNSFGLNFTQMNASLPNVTIFATGGTIAGSSSSNTATTGYTSGALGVLTLINAVPQILNVSNVAGVQISNVGSEDITSTILLNLAKDINKVVCGDPTMAGAVVTHGADTLEESAFFLDATVNCGKPVVVVGAMRPATAISADGPYNLLEAVTVAVTPASRHRGAMVVLNDRIASAFYVVKLDANTLDTFKALEMGYLGEMISDKPFYFYPPVTPTGKTVVDILYSYQDMHNDTLYNAIQSGVNGIVVAGAGAGGVSTSFNYAVEGVLNNHNIPVVQSMRTNSGEVPLRGVSSQTAMHIASGYLDPEKSRILLGLLLAQGKNMTEIAAIFAGSADD